jgi:hypothetical protein
MGSPYKRNTLKKKIKIKKNKYNHREVSTGCIGSLGATRRLKGRKGEKPCTVTSELSLEG